MGVGNRPSRDRRTEQRENRLPALRQPPSCRGGSSDEDRLTRPVCQMGSGVMPNRVVPVHRGWAKPRVAAHAPGRARLREGLRASRGQRRSRPCSMTPVGAGRRAGRDLRARTKYAKPRVCSALAGARKKAARPRLGTRTGESITILAPRTSVVALTRVSDGSGEGNRTLMTSFGRLRRRPGRLAS
jgi:hypothetical protein